MGFRCGGAGGGAQREPHHLARAVVLLPGSPRLAERLHEREPASGGLQGVDRGDARRAGGLGSPRGPGIPEHGEAGVAVVDGDGQPAEAELDLDGARLVRLRMTVDVAEQLRHAERSPVYERIELPVAQLRRNDSADLSDPQGQGLQFDDAVPAGMTDHGCDSPTSVLRVLHPR